MIPRNAEPCGHRPDKRVDLSPTYVEPPATATEKYIAEQERRRELTEGDRIWKLVRQASGEVQPTEPQPEPQVIDYSELDGCCG